MGNKQALGSPGAVRDSNRADTRARSWSFHGVNSRRKSHVAVVANSAVKSASLDDGMRGRSSSLHQDNRLLRRQHSTGATQLVDFCDDGDDDDEEEEDEEKKNDVDDGNKRVEELGLTGTENLLPGNSDYNIPAGAQLVGPHVHSAFSTAEKVITTRRSKLGSEPVHEHKRVVLEDPWVRLSEKPLSSKADKRRGNKREPPCRKELFKDSSKDSSPATDTPALQVFQESPKRRTTKKKVQIANVESTGPKEAELSEKGALEVGQDVSLARTEDTTSCLSTQEPHNKSRVLPFQLTDDDFNSADVKAIERSSSRSLSSRLLHPDRPVTPSSTAFAPITTGETINVPSSITTHAGSAQNTGSQNLPKADLVLQSGDDVVAAGAAPWSDVQKLMAAIPTSISSPSSFSSPSFIFQSQNQVTSSSSSVDSNRCQNSLQQQQQQRPVLSMSRSAALSSRHSDESISLARHTSLDNSGAQSPKSTDIESFVFRSCMQLETGQNITHLRKRSENRLSLDLSKLSPAKQVRNNSSGLNDFSRRLATLQEGGTVSHSVDEVTRLYSHKDKLKVAFNTLSDSSLDTLNRGKKAGRSIEFNETAEKRGKPGRKTSEGSISTTQDSSSNRSSDNYDCRSPDKPGDVVTSNFARTMTSTDSGYSTGRSGMSCDQTSIITVIPNLRAVYPHTDNGRCKSPDVNRGGEGARRISRHQRSRSTGLEFARVEQSRGVTTHEITSDNKNMESVQATRAGKEVSSVADKTGRVVAFVKVTSNESSGLEEDKVNPRVSDARNFSRGVEISGGRVDGSAGNTEMSSHSGDRFEKGCENLLMIDDVEDDGTGEKHGGIVSVKTDDGECGSKEGVTCSSNDGVAENFNHQLPDGRSIEREDSSLRQPDLRALKNTTSTDSSGYTKVSEHHSSPGSVISNLSDSSFSYSQLVNRKPVTRDSATCENLPEIEGTAQGLKPDHLPPALTAEARSRHTLNMSCDGGQARKQVKSELSSLEELCALLLLQADEMNTSQTALLSGSSSTGTTNLQPALLMKVSATEGESGNSLPLLTVAHERRPDTSGKLVKQKAVSRQDCPRQFQQQERKIDDLSSVLSTSDLATETRLSERECSAGCAAYLCGGTAGHEEENDANDQVDKGTLTPSTSGRLHLEDRQFIQAEKSPIPDREDVFSRAGFSWFSSRVSTAARAGPEEEEEEEDFGRRWDIGMQTSRNLYSGLTGGQDKNSQLGPSYSNTAGHSVEVHDEDVARRTNSTGDGQVHCSSRDVCGDSKVSIPPPCEAYPPTGITVANNVASSATSSSSSSHQAPVQHSRLTLHNESVTPDEGVGKETALVHDSVKDKFSIQSSATEQNISTCESREHKNPRYVTSSVSDCCVTQASSKADTVKNVSSRNCMEVTNPGYETDSLERNVTASKLREVSQTLYGDKVEGHWKLSQRFANFNKTKQKQKASPSSKLTTLTRDLTNSANFIGELSRRRGAAILNRDLSLSEKSMLDSLEKDYAYPGEENGSKSKFDPSENFAENVKSIYSEGEKCLSVDACSYPLDVARSYTASGFQYHASSDLNLASPDNTKSHIDLLDTSASMEMLDSRVGETGNDEEFELEMRPRTNSATAAELGGKSRGRIAMGMASARLRRSYASPVKEKYPVPDIYAQVVKPPKLSTGLLTPLGPHEHNTSVDAHGYLPYQTHSAAMSPGHKFLASRSLQSTSPLDVRTVPDTTSTREAQESPIYARVHKNGQLFGEPHQTCQRFEHSQSMEESFSHRFQPVQSLGLPQTSMKHSNSIDMTSANNVEHSGLGFGRSQNLNIPRQRRSLDSAQRYLSQSADFTGGTFDNCYHGQYPYSHVAPDFYGRQPPSSFDNFAANKENMKCMASSLPAQQSTFQALHAPMSRASINLAPLPEENQDQTSHDGLSSSVPVASGFHRRYQVVPNYKDPPFPPHYNMRGPYQPIFLSQLQNQRSSSVHNIPARDPRLQYFKDPFSVAKNMIQPHPHFGYNAVDKDQCRSDSYPPEQVYGGYMGGVRPRSHSSMSASADLATRLRGSYSGHALETCDRAWSYSVTSLVEGANFMGLLGEDQDSMMDIPSMDVCPACHRPFDSGKKRKLIDSCGHERCYTCMFNSEVCPICLAQAQMQRDAPRPLVDPSGYTAHRPKLKTNGHLMGGLKGRSELPELPPRASMTSPSGAKMAPPVPAKPKYFQPIQALSPAFQNVNVSHGYDHHRGPNHYSSDSALGSAEVSCKSTVSMASPEAEQEKGKDSPPPPPPDVAQNDLMMRLGLLLGDRVPPGGVTGVGIPGLGIQDQHHHGNQQGETGFSTISSLSSSEHTPERGLSDTSPMSTLTVSSGSELGTPVRGHHAHSGSLYPMGSRDLSADSVASLMSTNSVSPQTTTQRPHSITTSMPGAIEDLPLFGKRRSSLRRSGRATVSDGKIRFTPIKPPQLQIQPIVFEVPHPEGKPVFVGRAWLFSELEAVLCGEGSGASRPGGVVIVGGLGSGKTAIVEQLVDHSCFGDGHSGLVCAKPQSKPQQSRSASNTQLTDYAALNGLGFQVVAYHLCQADNNSTCMVADMVSSIAAQLARAPQLAAYRDLLLQEPQLQNLLSIRECIQNPSLSFLKGILEPLRMLKNAGKIFSDSCIILVDSLNEAEFHKPDHGDTIASFLCRHANKFPAWLKLVVTVQTALQEITSTLPFQRIYLDRHGDQSENVAKDITDYVDHRVSISASIRSNIAINGRLDKELQAKFSSHVQSLSKGSFLYAKLVLDLIEKGQLVAKSTNYKILPVNLSEVFLLHFNLKFSSVRAFERVSTILGVCLAALYPLTLEDIFLTVNSGFTQRYLSWEDFCQRMSVLAGFLFRRHDNTYMFFHPAFREWLIRRDETDSPKFLCDLRNGHALMAFRLSRVSAPLPPDKTIELGHHILKAHIYKTISRQLGYSSRDMQAYWMCLSSHSLNQALVSHRNIYSPNVKVSRLILLSGGNPNTRTEYLSNAPLLCVATREGFSDMVAVLMEFGADPNASSDTGMTPLCHAAAAGHREVMRMLCLQNARLSAQDNQGQCAAIHAVIHGQLESLMFLLQLNWAVITGEPTKDDAITQCFVASAATGNRQILEYLHQAYSGSRLNLVDSLLSETALTAACLHGRKDAVHFLLEAGADVTIPNSKSFTPLLCAAKSGRWEICDTLLATGAELETTDKYGRSPLMIAAEEGHTGVVNLLLDKGANQTSTDKEGLTALCWACLRGHMLAVESLVKRGSNIHHTDNSGRSPLHLAVFYGDANIVQYLIDNGAQIEHTDLSGMRALDHAIACRNTAIIVCFLRKGAKLGPDTWAMAAGKTDVLLLLLNKLMEDGNVLYKKNRIKEASQRYQYALKKFPKESSPDEAQTFRDLRLNFLLNLSRCKRKMNDLPSAIDLATKALEMRPNCFEAFYARARAKRDDRQYAAAQQDLVEALRLAPKNRELQRLLIRVKEECQEQMTRYESGIGVGGAGPEMDRISEDEDDSLAIDQQVADETAL